MHGKYYTTDVKIEELGNGETAFADADVLFNWTRFEIPKGTACLKSIQIAMKGTNGADANKHDIELYFAKSIDGVAPTAFGTLNGAATALLSAACRRNIIGFKLLDASSRADDEDLLGYNVWGSGIATVADLTTSDLMLSTAEDTAFTGTTAGYQSIWIAGIAKGAFDFGTAIVINMAAGQAAVELASGNNFTQHVQITTSGTDPRNVFQVGDIVQAQDNAKIGPVVSVDSATTMTVNGVEEALANTDTINWKYPLEFVFGFEY